MSRSFVRTKALPLPGFTCWNSTMVHSLPLNSMHMPFLKSAVEIAILGNPFVHGRSAARRGARSAFKPVHYSVSGKPCVRTSTVSEKNQGEPTGRTRNRNACRGAGRKTAPMTISGRICWMQRRIGPAKAQMAKIVRLSPPDFRSLNCHGCRFAPRNPPPGRRTGYRITGSWVDRVKTSKPSGVITPKSSRRMPNSPGR